MCGNTVGRKVDYNIRDRIINKVSGFLPNPMIIPDFSLQLSLDQVFRAQGINTSKKERIRQKLIENTIKAIEIGTPLLKPAVVYERYPVHRITEKAILLEGGRALENQVVARHLMGSCEIVPSVCTIGDGVDRLTAELFLTDPGLALALEGFASAAVVVLGNEFCNVVEKQVKSAGLRISSPINPGIDGWPVEQAQPQVFSLVEASQIGVQLDVSGLMRPLKSLSLVFGIGSHLSKHQISCEMCNLRTTCLYQPV